MHVSCKGKTLNIEDLKSHNSAYFRLWRHRVGFLQQVKKNYDFLERLQKKAI